MPEEKLSLSVEFESRDIDIICLPDYINSSLM